MKTIYSQVKYLLENHPALRERRNRYKAIWELLHDKYQKDMWGKETFLIVGPEILSITRIINKVQEEHKELRGSDYADGKILSQQTQVNLGYEPGYHQDMRKLETLADMTGESELITRKEK